jgi:hypothetical protein
MPMLERTLSSVTVACVFGLLAFGCIPKEEKPQDTKAQPATPPPPPPPEPARSALKVSPETSYVLRGVESNRCVQFTGGSNADGAMAEIQACKDTNAQQFKLQAVAGGYYRLVNVLSNKCLAADATSQDTGSRVTQSACGDAPHMQWILADAPGGALQLVARHNGKALDINEGKTADGTAVIVWPAKVSPNQSFKLEPVGGATPDAAHAGKAGAGGAAGTAGAEGGKRDKGKKSKAAAPAAASAKP